MPIEPQQAPPSPHNARISDGMLFAVVSVLSLGAALGGLYVLVRFVKWAWTG